jgi:hypothetical protein
MTAKKQTANRQSRPATRPDELRAAEISAERELMRQLER